MRDSKRKRPSRFDWAFFFIRFLWVWCLGIRTQWIPWRLEWVLPILFWFLPTQFLRQFFSLSPLWEFVVGMPTTFAINSCVGGERTVAEYCASDIAWIVTPEGVNRDFVICFVILIDDFALEVHFRIPFQLDKKIIACLYNKCPVQNRPESNPNRSPALSICVRYLFWHYEIAVCQLLLPGVLRILWFAARPSRSASIYYSWLTESLATPRK